jgi:hypothetical protein
MKPLTQEPRAPESRRSHSAAQATEPASSAGSFRLLRYFAWASLLVVVAAAVALTWLYGRKAEQALLLQGEQKNSAQLRLILNHLIDTDRAVLNELLASRVAPNSDAAVVQRMVAIVDKSVAGTTVIKLKLFNLAGLTVFSSELRQIGEDKANYPGFVAAAAGSAASQLSHRESFASIGGTLRQVDVIGSYLPVRDPAGRIVGVVEIYDNVTLLAKAIADTRWQIMGLSVLLLLVLYLALVAIVRHAAAVLRAKEQTLEREVNHRARLTAELQRSLKQAEDAQRATEHATATAHAARRDAEAASIAKTEFLHAVVARMRTPINTAIGLIDVLSVSETNEIQRMRLAEIRRHALSTLDQLTEQLNESERGRPAAATAVEHAKPARIASAERSALAEY